MEFTEGHKRKLDRLDVLIRGNGEIGMRADVKNNTEILDKVVSALNKANWLIVTTLLTVVITLLITLANQ